MTIGQLYSLLEVHKLEGQAPLYKEVKGVTQPR